MDNDITVIHHHPASLGLSLYAAFPFVLFAGFFHHAIGQGIQHAAAGGGAYYEVICKGSDPLDVQEQDIFTFFIFQGVYNGMCKFQCIQKSPLY
jgi:hypothetical protein